MNSYIKKYLKAFKDCKTDAEIENIINKVYEDGFYDGTTEQCI